MPQTERIYFRITPEFKSRLQTIAESKGIKLAALIKDCLEVEAIRLEKEISRDKNKSK